MIEIEILPGDSGKKLHRYLRQTLPGVPLSGLHKMIRTGRVKVNGKKARRDAELAPGDRVSLWMREEDYQAVSRSQEKFSGMPAEIAVLYEDSDLLIVDKPPGLLTHPDPSEHKDTLVGRVHAYLHAHGELPHGRSFLPAAVNRLDRNTSGIVLFGKNAPALRSLGEAMRERRIEKTYLTLVHGRLPESGDIRAPLVRDAQSGVTRVADGPDPEAREAHTRYERISGNERFSLARVWLVSGRTHQIRIHMRSVGCPLAGDLKYGGRPVPGLSHHLLHAESLTLPDGRRFIAPIPPHFCETVGRAGLSCRIPGPGPE